MSETNQGAGPGMIPPLGGSPQQRVVINVQYIKDLSFENPRAPQSLAQQPTTPAVDINIDVNATPLGPENYEVALTVNANAKTSSGEAIFILELVYCALVTVQNVPRDMLPPVLLVETPRLLFPFARAIVSEATQNGGFPPLMINPVDFSEILRRNQTQPASAPAFSIPPAAPQSGA